MPRGPTNKHTFSHSMGDDFDRIMGIVCETAVMLAHVEHSNIVVYDSASATGTVSAEFPHKVGTLGKSVKAEEGFVERHLLKTINPIVVEDVERDRRRAGSNIRALSPAIKSSVIVPIVVDDDVREDHLPSTSFRKNTNLALKTLSTLTLWGK